ncbi:zinc-binding alcohol dehydrogenase [Breoghania sp. JC706]|uniref:zinc-dependent alcohol dehydrogenase n=1 Tax=Breoghania sp. JC706 TaxID=3117732 RepID=UPI00300B5A6E
MKRVLASASGEIVVEETAPPQTASGHVLIAASCSLISPGTELHYRGEAGRRGVPMPLGYCSSGTVIETGAGVEGLSAGDRVVAMGWGHALHAGIVAVPQRLCRRLPDDVDFEHGVFAALICTALHARARAGPVAGTSALVIGAGLVGHLVARTLRLGGADLGLSDIDVGRMTRTRADFQVVAGPTGWETRPARDIDIIVLTLSGRHDDILARCAASLRREPNGRPIGRIVVVGRLETRVAFDVTLGNIDVLNAAHAGYGYRDAAYVSGHVSYPPPPGQSLVDDNLAEAVELVAAGGVDPASLHTHRFAVEDAAQAYSLLADPASGALGVTLHYRETT